MTDYDISNAMIAYGGSFVQQLGKLFRLADDDNQARIKAAWPEYWKNYEELARRRQTERLTSGTTPTTAADASSRTK
jgi:hypothetical protein